MLYQIHNGAVKFAADTILKNINFEIRDTEKIAVVGRNGCGKTTLLRLIVGEVDLSKRDSDFDIFISKAGNPVIGYLKQMAFEDNELTLEEEIRKAFIPILELEQKMEELLHRLEEEPDEKYVKKYTDAQERFNWLGGYEYEREYEIILKQFGFTHEDYHKKLSEFSGGQQTKIAFAKLLLSKPDVLLLDEPTNHLDISTIEWLEGYLKAYKRAVVIVSHDRMFLDKVVDVVYEIEYKTAVRYPGNYTAFVNQKRLNFEKQLKDYTIQQKEIERLNTLVDRFKNKPTKVAMTRSKLKQIEHMDKVEAPARYDLRTFHINCAPKRSSGKEVLKVNQLEIGYTNVLSTISFNLKRGQKLAVIGANGIGKSTLLKTLAGMIPALNGSYQYGILVDVGYFDQQIAQYTTNKTVLNEFCDEFPTLTQTEARTLLGSFLFTQDEVFKQISMLSGGERARLALAKILKHQPNFLILDEPTNHMDIVGKETLEAMLSAYTGTVIFVSHDRYFVRQAADSLLIFMPETVIYYPYGYEQYLEDNIDIKKYSENSETKDNNKKVELQNDVFKDIKKESSQKNINNSSREIIKIERQLKKIEELINECEIKLQAQRDDLYNPDYSVDYEKLTKIQESIKSDEELLEDLMYEWSKVSDELEKQ